MKFVKMHGCGNDFIIIEESTPPSPSVIQKLCDRHFGIGADQFFNLLPSAKADIRMDIWNTDGSRAEMCGNGIRAVALYLKKYGLSGFSNTAKENLKNRTDYSIETLAGVQTVSIKTGKEEQVTVNMGEPKIDLNPKTLTVDSQSFFFYQASIGNPHAVLFQEDQSFSLIPKNIGSSIENHSFFPNRTNVEFVNIVSPTEIEVTVWERGAGLTLACGSGACAAMAVTHLIKKGASKIKVQLPGGVLECSWEGIGHPLWMTGPAQEVFKGEIAID